MRKQFLFIGINGMGMAPLAIYLRQQGHIVYGYDDNQSDVWAQIFDQLAIVMCGYFPKKIDEVIYSNAIHLDHPWIIEAKKRGIKLIRRGDFLSQIDDKKMIAIAGSHGKTSVTGLLIDRCPKCNYILGGYFIDHQKLPAQYREENDYLICEVDESDRTIENYHPYVSVILNLEDDHLINYGTSKQLDEAFRKLITQTRHAVLFPSNCERLMSIFKSIFSNFEYNNSIICYYPQEKRLISISDEKFTYLSRSELMVHCVAKVLTEQGVYVDDRAKTTPIARRNQFLGKINATEIWGDYAHHPTEVEYSMRHFEQRYRDITFVFQPHRYSRTRQYAEQFANILKTRNAYLMPIYSAGESPIPNGNVEEILKHSPENIKLIQKLDFLSNVNPNAIVFIGAGDIDRYAWTWLHEQQIIQLISWLQSESIDFTEQASIKNLNTLRIFGNLRLLVAPKSIEELKALIAYCKEKALTYAFLGNGSNILFDKTDGIWITLKSLPQELEINDGTVIASANTSLVFFCTQLAKLGIAGCENLAGIPGTLAGALRMNAGAHSQAIFDHLSSITVLRQGEVVSIKKEAIKYGYRHGLQNEIILGAQFSFSDKESPNLLLEKINNLRAWRLEKQPQKPNIGSIFKNPENTSAGALIDACGLKGILHGGAKISEKHANFIVNDSGDATADDIKFLINLCQQRVFEQHNIYLQREILFASELC